jgi:hypothetical protein
MCTGLRNYPKGIPQAGSIPRKSNIADFRDAEMGIMCLFRSYGRLGELAVLVSTTAR